MIILGVIRKLSYLCKREESPYSSLNSVIMKDRSDVGTSSPEIELEEKRKMRYVSFDWAMKRILRDKANFAVLEGLFTVLLDEPVHIVELLESESNRETDEDKQNRVDVKAKNDKGEIFIIEVQLAKEYDFIARLLYGVSKTISEHIFKGNKYAEVKKVYSISIVYFNMGKGDDYLYHGTTDFVGVHTKDHLKLGELDRDRIRMITPADVFPEYYIIRVNEFNKVATTPLEEWIDFLKRGHIDDDTVTPGLVEARKRLSYMMMSDADREAFDNYFMYNWKRTSEVKTSWMEGHAEGVEEGLKKGLQKSKQEIVLRMKDMGIDTSVIATATGLSIEEIEAL